MMRFPAELLNPARVAPSIFGETPRPADAYVLIGGSSQLTAGGAIADGIDDVSGDQVLMAMVEAGFQDAWMQGLVPAALHIRNDQVAAFRGGEPSKRQAVAIDTFACLPVASMPQYLASLGHSRRSVVRRDWKRFAALGLHAATEPAGEVIEEAAPLVVSVRERHAIADDPRLAALRLALWAASDPGRRLAFTVRSSTGLLLAVCFGCHHGEVLELYEIGLTEDSSLRQAAYFESMVYAPLRYAVSSGCRTIHLGQGAARPKQLRGARVEAVWAVGRPREEE
jgi:hypothetical protein